MVTNSHPDSPRSRTAPSKTRLHSIRVTIKDWSLSIAVVDVAALRLVILPFYCSRTRMFTSSRLDAAVPSCPTYTRYSDILANKQRIDQTTAITATYEHYDVQTLYNTVYHRFPQGLATQIEFTRELPPIFRRRDSLNDEQNTLRVTSLAKRYRILSGGTHWQLRNKGYAIISKPISRMISKKIDESALFPSKHAIKQPRKPNDH